MKGRWNRWPAVLCLLAAGLAFAPACRTHRLPAADPLLIAGPWGRVVHCAPDRAYAIIDFDVWPEPGQELRLVDAGGPTGIVRVSDRRLGSCFIVTTIEGTPKTGDYVALTEEEVEDTHADD